MGMPRLRAESTDDNEKPWIALDVDGTLADIHTILIDIINKRYGKKENGEDFTVADITNWSFDKTELPINDTQFLELHKEIWMTRWCDIAPLVCEELLLELSKYYNIAIVTNRPEESVKPLVEWLKANFPNLTYKLIANAVDHDKSKQSFSIYIDDSPSLARKIALQEGRTQHIRDAPWNQDAPQSPNVIRLPDTETVVKTLIQECKAKEPKQRSKAASWF